MQIPLLVVAIALGIGFRLSHLDDKIFWVDEVATAIRVAGYTRAEVIHQLSDGRLLSVSDLQYYTQVGGRSLQDTFHALAQSPEHTPLYFLLTRLWVDGWGSVWGSSAASFRSLSLVASLLTLPSLYWLSVELFRSRLTGAIAVVLFALSPFFVSYAQEARPYSLWVLLLTLSGAALLWALRRNRPQQWVLYGLLVALCAYTSLLSLPVLVGHGLYAIATTSHWGLRWLGTDRDSASAIPSALMSLSFSGRLDNRARHALIALGLGLLTLLPWLGLALGRWDTLQDNTTWARSPMALPIRLAIWLYSLAIVVFDVPIAPFPSAMAAVQAAIAATVLGLFGLSCYWLCTQTAPRTWLWLLLLALPTPLTLGLIDGISGGQVSATSRYLMPAQLALLLALVGMFGRWLEQWLERWRSDRAVFLGQQRFRAVAIAFILSLSLISCLGNLGRSPDYQKARNIHNPAIAALLNPVSAPVVLAEPAQTLDLISLSYALDRDTRFQIESGEQLLAAIPSCTGDRFWFNPSPDLRQLLQRNPALRVTELYRPKLLTPDDIYLSLWQIQPKPSACPDDSGNAGA